MLFFLPDPERAAAEFRRVLRPGGRIAVSTWAEEAPRWAWEDDLIPAAGRTPRRAILRPFYREETEIHFATEQQRWEWHWSFSLRGLLEQLNQAEVEAIRDASSEQLAPLKTPAGYQMQLSAWIVTGRTD
jgi:SAM-dependent methyltransferase